MTHAPNLPVEIASWPRNSRETIKVALCEFKGNILIDLGSWWLNAAGELKPGKGRTVLSVKHLPAMAAALNKALATARALGILPDGGDADAH